LGVRVPPGVPFLIEWCSDCTRTEVSCGWADPILGKCKRRLRIRRINPQDCHVDKLQ